MLPTMRVKSAYKAKPEPSPVEVNVAAADIPAPEVDKLAQASEAEGAEVIRQQMESLRKATEHERAQAAEHVQPSPDDVRAARLAHWRQNGLPESEVEFLKAHPIMLDAPELTYMAACEAAQAGHQVGTPEFHEHVRNRFDFHMGEVHRRASAVPPAAQPTPEFFAPPEPPAPAPPDQSSLVAAPVSREVNWSGRSYTASSPDQIRLTAAQREAARMSGLTDIQYAKQLIELDRRKAAGLIQS
jgi:hypothetical protein